MQSYGGNAFLAFLSAPDLAAVRPQLAPFDLRLGDCLHRPDDRIEYVIFPHSGLVAMSMPSQEGARAEAFLVGSDGFIGGLAAAAAACAFCEARVHIAGEASRMSATAFFNLLDQNPSVRRLAAQFDCAMLAQVQQTAVCNAVHSVEARLCRLLLEIQDRCNSSKIPLTHSALAQMLGVRRTTVTVIAGRLEAAGLIDTRRGYVKIINREELERRSCECYGQVRTYVIRLFANSKTWAEFQNVGR